jgi:hydrogenase nickel insertion protein HypA
MSLIERVEQEMQSHQATAAHRINISVGELSGVEAELLVSAFEIARESTVLTTTDLVITRIKARWLCSHCSQEVNSEETLSCANCGSPARLVEGGDILFESVELEV